MIRLKNMSEIPKSCKECKFVYRTWGIYLCPLLKNWLEKWQILEGKTKLDDCPLEEA